MIDVNADLPHPVPPRALGPPPVETPLPVEMPLPIEMPWKENWCFAGIDPDASTAMVWHISLRPGDGEGIFTCKFDGPDLRVRHVGRHPLPPDGGDKASLSDGHVTFTVVEPHRVFALRYRGVDAEVDCTATARFEPFDFADGPPAPGPSRIGELGRHVFPFNHYEQALTFVATVRRPDHDDLELSGWSNRDHSWGWRDDFGFRSHHWICASFAEAYVQGSTMIDTTYPDRKHGGFISAVTGNDAVSHVDVSDAYWEEPLDEPLPSLDRDVRYRLTTVGGRTIDVTAHLSERYTVLYLNARHPDRSQVYQDAQLFCPFTRHDTGERGAGLLELGKHVSDEGIADRVGR